MGGYYLEGASGPARGPMMFFPSCDVEVIDTWHVGGMRGTGSHDFSVNEVFVPAERAFNVVVDPPRHGGPLYKIPTPLTLASGLAPLSLGMARGAIDCFVEMMDTRTDRYLGSMMKQRFTVQERVAKAEALVRSARAFLYEAVDELWDAIQIKGELDDRQTATYRLALMNSVASGAQAIDLVYHAAATNSIRTDNLLERFFRDIHVATQHRSATPEDIYQVGAILLGASPAQ